MPLAVRDSGSGRAVGGSSIVRYPLNFWRIFATILIAAVVGWRVPCRVARLGRRLILLVARELSENAWRIDRRNRRLRAGPRPRGRKTNGSGGSPTPPWLWLLLIGGFALIFWQFVPKTEIQVLYYPWFLSRSTRRQHQERSRSRGPRFAASCAGAAVLQPALADRPRRCGSSTRMLRRKR